MRGDDGCAGTTAESRRASSPLFLAARGTPSSLLPPPAKGRGGGAPRGAAGSRQKRLSARHGGDFGPWRRASGLTTGPSWDPSSGELPLSFVAPRPAIEGGRSSCRRTTWPGPPGDGLRARPQAPHRRFPALRRKSDPTKPVPHLQHRPASGPIIGTSRDDALSRARRKEYKLRLRNKSRLLFKGRPAPRTAGPPALIKLTIFGGCRIACYS
jgi:hypothetical protein